VLSPLLLLWHRHYCCHIIATVIVVFIVSFGMHGAAELRASADGSSSITQDAVAIVVHRGTGLRGPMDRSEC